MNDATNTTETTRATTRQQEAKDLLANYLRTFECPAGRAVLEHLHATTGTRLSSFWPDDGFNAISAAKRDGGKTLVWAIEATLEKARAASRTEEPSKPKTTGRRSSRRQSA